jgi:hypothetical protein
MTKRIKKNPVIIIKFNNVINSFIQKDISYQPRSESSPL